MTTPDTAARPVLRSQRLNQITHEPHQMLDALVKAHKPLTPAKISPVLSWPNTCFNPSCNRSTPTRPCKTSFLTYRLAAVQNKPRLTWQT